MKKFLAIILALTLCMTTALAAVATERQPATTDLVLDSKDTFDIVFVYDNKDNLGSSGIEWERHCFKFLDRLMWENEGIGIRTNFIQYRSTSVSLLTKDMELIDYNPRMYENMIDLTGSPYFLDTGENHTLTEALMVARKCLRGDSTVKDDHKFIIILTDSSDLNLPEKQLAIMKQLWGDIDIQFNTGSVVIFSAKDREIHGEGCQHWFTEYCDHALELNWKEYNTPISSEDWVKVDDFFDLMFKVVSEAYMNSVTPNTPSDPTPDEPTPDEPCDPPTPNYRHHDAYIQGYNGQFFPNDTLTRGAAITMLYRLLDPAVQAQYQTSVSPFSDMNESNWYNTEVATMAAAGYVNGTPDGTFGGERAITRGEFVTIMVRFMGIHNSTGTTTIFTDIEGNWAQSYIEIAASRGWVQGYNNLFRPNDPVTRAEAVTIINRAFNRGVNATNATNLFSDVSANDWFYYEVIEAAVAHDYIGVRPNENWIR